MIILYMLIYGCLMYLVLNYFSILLNSLSLINQIIISLSAGFVCAILAMVTDIIRISRK